MIGELYMQKYTSRSTPKFYKHYKGVVYMVTSENAKHSETGERLVTYMNPNGHVWVRPYDMFHGLTEDGTKRFEQIERP